MKLRNYSMRNCPIRAKGYMRSAALRFNQIFQNSFKNLSEIFTKTFQQIFFPNFITVQIFILLKFSQIFNKFSSNILNFSSEILRFLKYVRIFFCKIKSFFLIIQQNYCIMLIHCSVLYSFYI